MTSIHARRLLGVALALGVAAEVLFFGFPIGLNFPVWVLLVLLCTWLVRPAGRAIDPMDAWLIPAALAFSGLVALRSDELLVMFDLLAATTLTGAAATAMAGIAVTRRSVTTVAALAGAFLIAVLAGPTPLADRARPAAGSFPTVRDRSAAAAPVVRGLLLAIPILLVFGLLFASADAVFARMTGDLLSFSWDIEELAYRVAMVAVAAWVAAGVLWLVASGPERSADTRAAAIGPGSVTLDDSNANRRAAARAGPLWDGYAALIGSTEAVVLLIAVDLLFAFFVMLQVTYLFGGLDTLSASGVTYSEYARRGFFELIAVVVLVGGLVIGLETTVVQRTRAYVIAATSLVVLAVLVLASALLRLRLYQDAYGWTELRFYALAAIAWLGACLAFAAVTLLAGRTRWLVHAVGIAALVVALAVNVIDPPAFVARENLARALEPSRVPPDGETGFDAVYVAALGYDAVPVVLDALPRLPSDERAILTRSLRVLRDRLRNRPVTSWQGWNLARERARTELETRLGVP